jgi:hypothetical protein
MEVTRITHGQEVRPGCSDDETPGDDDRAAREAAAAVWFALAPLLAGTRQVRVSWDKGKQYKKGRYGSLRWHDSVHPVTIAIYDRVAGTGRLIVLDLDASRAKGGDRAGQVAAQAAAIAALVAACGGRCVTDVSPGGRHVYILFAEPRPWTQLRDLARALAARFPLVDTSPMCVADGQITPPGSRHKSGGWRVLDGPLEAARAALEAPCGPEVLEALTEALAAELAAVAPGVTAVDAAVEQLCAAPAMPAGHRRRLPAHLDAIARTGSKGRYATRSEARYAVLCSASARGWALADVQAAIGSGAWAGLAGLYPRAGEPDRITRLLGQEYRSAAAFVRKPAAPGKGKRVQGSDTSDTDHQPPPPSPLDDLDAVIVFGIIRQWLNVPEIAAADHDRVRGWGQMAVSVRLVLTALGLAAMVSGSPRVAFGVRNLALRAGLSADTVAVVLEQLRSEPDPMIRLVRRHRLEKADTYDLIVPAAYEQSVRWRGPRAGLVDAIHPAFLAVGKPEAILYQHLTGSEESGRELARTASLPVSTAAAALTELAAHGLAERGPGGGWRRGPASLYDVADTTGASDTWREREAAYKHDRDDWHEKIAKWLEPKPQPRTADPDPPLPFDDVQHQTPLPFEELSRPPPVPAGADAAG